LDVRQLRCWVELVRTGPDLGMGNMGSCPGPPQFGGPPQKEKKIFLYIYRQVFGYAVPGKTLHLYFKLNSPSLACLVLQQIINNRLSALLIVSFGDT